MPFLLVAPSNMPPLLTVPLKQCLLLPLCPSEPNRTPLPNWTSFLCVFLPHTLCAPQGKVPGLVFYLLHVTPGVPMKILEGMNT